MGTILKSPAGGRGSVLDEPAPLAKGKTRRAGTKLRGFFQINIYSPFPILVLIHMGLDINEKEKGALPRLVVKAHSNAGNSFAGGIMESSMHTKSLEPENFMTMGFYFPVDCVIWDAGINVSACVNRDNDNSDTSLVLTSRTTQPTNAEGIVRVGMQFFSPRDKLYGSVDPGDDKGTTPFFPNTYAKKDDLGLNIDWSINDGDPEEVPLHSSPGWLNKAARMTLLYATQTTSGGSRNYKVNFTRKVRGKSKGFSVDAGTMLVYYVYNHTGGADSDLQMNLQVEAVPRINFFPKKDIIQNLMYVNRSKQRWEANHEVQLQTDEGQGVNRLFTAVRVSEAKP